MDATLPLIAAAASVGFLHTIIGVDHTLPFVLLGRANGWGLYRTLGVTLLCGSAHIFSALLIGGIGLSAGWAAGRLDWLDEHRGLIAGWALVGLGLMYCAAAVVRRRRRAKAAGVAKGAGSPPTSVTIGMLLAVFVIGPTEPLVPLVILPAVDGGLAALLPVVIAFAATTLVTMTVLVGLAYRGLDTSFGKRFVHVGELLAGAMLILVGIGLLFFDL